MVAISPLSSVMSMNAPGSPVPEMVGVSSLVCDPSAGASSVSVGAVRSMVRVCVMDAPLFWASRAIAVTRYSPSTKPVSGPRVQTPFASPVAGTMRWLPCASSINRSTDAPTLTAPSKFRSVAFVTVWSGRLRKVRLGGTSTSPVLNVVGSSSRFPSAKSPTGRFAPSVVPKTKGSSVRTRTRSSPMSSKGVVEAVNAACTKWEVEAASTVTW